MNTVPTRTYLTTPKSKCNIPINNGYDEKAKYPISNDPVWAVEFLYNDKFAFVDSNHYYEVDLLRGQPLIDAARKWLETHKI